jgi:hypothetical protein
VGGVLRDGRAREFYEACAASALPAWRGLKNHAKRRTGSRLDGGSTGAKVSDNFDAVLRLRRSTKPFAGK